jgi:hypothetical protein
MKVEGRSLMVDKGVVKELEVLERNLKKLLTTAESREEDGE